MSLKIGSNIVVSNSRRADIENLFLKKYTRAQLESINGTSVGDMAYCSDLSVNGFLGAIVLWNGENWSLSNVNISDANSVTRTNLTFSVEGNGYDGVGTTWYAEYGTKNFSLIPEDDLPSHSYYPPYISFNGTNQFAYSQDEFEAEANSFSMEVWFRTDTANGEILAGVNNTQTGGITGYDRHIYMGTDGKIYFGCYDGSVRVVSSDEGMKDNIWRQVVGVYDVNAAMIYLYINGNFVAQNTCGSLKDIGVRFVTIAGGRTSNWPSGRTDSRHYTEADIGIVRCYNNRALSQSEILGNFSARRLNYGI